MRIDEYLESVRALVNNMTREELASWALDRAKATRDWDDFLDSLENSSGSINSVDDAFAFLDKLLNGKLKFVVDDNRGPYASSEYIYYDRRGIGKKIAKCVALGYELFDAKSYDKAYALLDGIYSQVFECDYIGKGYINEDNSLLFLPDLNSQGFTDINIDDLFIHILYSCFKSTTGEERLEKLLGCFWSSFNRRTLMSEAFIYGHEKIDEVKEFMREWCDYLLKHDDLFMMHLVVDAGNYIGEDYIFNVTKENIATHPAILLEYGRFLIEEGNYKKCLEVFGSLFPLIDKDKPIRARIADLGVEVAEAVGDKELLAYYAKAAVYSKPCVLRALRAAVYGGDSLDEAIERVKSIPQITDYSPNFNYDVDAPRTFTGYERDLYLLLLGSKDFAIPSTFGKGFTFRSLDKTIVYLLMLGLKEQVYIPTLAEAELEEDPNSIFDSNLVDKWESAEVDKLLSPWRAFFLSHAVNKEENIKELEELVEAEVDYLLGEVRSSYYKDIAKIIVLLDEILWQYGLHEGRKTLMEKYSEKYPRKRGFLKALDYSARHI